MKFQHPTVNHARNLVNQQTKDYTKRVESIYCYAKMRNKKETSKEKSTNRKKFYSYVYVNRLYAEAT